MQPRGPTAAFLRDLGEKNLVRKLKLLFEQRMGENQ